MTNNQRARLWDEINRYVATCGGDASKHVYGNTPRQVAVSQIEAIIREVEAAWANDMRNVAEARVADLNLDELLRLSFKRAELLASARPTAAAGVSYRLAVAVPSLIAEVRRLHWRLPSAEELEAIAAAASAYDSDYNGADVRAHVDLVQNWIVRQREERGGASMPSRMQDAAMWAAFVHELRAEWLEDERRISEDAYAATRLVFRRLDEWHEDEGPALWWRLPVDERQAVTSEQAAKDIKILEQIHAKSWDEAVALRHAAEALSERDERAERIGRAVLETFEQAKRAFFDDPESPPPYCANFQCIAENAAFDLDEVGWSYGLVAARILLAIADEMEERGG